jgi:hypothetical protein
MLLPPALYLCLLRFGNPQWHSRIYVFQAYHWPGHGGGLMQIPAGFSGTWRDWYADRTLRFEAVFVHGRICGEYAFYDRAGNVTDSGTGVGLSVVETSTEGEDNAHLMIFNPAYRARPSPAAAPQGFSGVWTRWHEGGTKRSDEHYVDGVRHGQATYWDPDEARKVASGVWRMGKPWEGTFLEGDSRRWLTLVTYHDGNRTGRSELLLDLKAEMHRE